MEEHVLDLSKRHWTFSRHGLTAIGTWVRIDERWRPCMAIVRNGAPPCVIPLENAWMWSSLGTPEAHAAAFCAAMGIDFDNPDNIHKLVDLVQGRMQEFVTMPPRPPDAVHNAVPVAEITIRTELGRTEVEI